MTGNAYVSTNLKLLNDAGIEVDGVADITNSTTSTSTTSGALKVTGGVSTQENLNVGGTAKMWDATDTTSMTSGAVQIVGGLGVSKNIYGKDVNFEAAEVNSLDVTDTTASTSMTSGAVQIAGGLGVEGNVYAAAFYGDGSQLTGSISVTDITTTSNIDIGGSISLGALTINKIPFTGGGKYLADSHITNLPDSTIITSNLEVLGNIIVSGESYTVNSESLLINDRIIGIANNNVSHQLDVGIILQHPGKNIALVHHGAAVESDPHDHKFTIGYTQNTITDNHIYNDSNIISVEILGNLTTQNNLIVSETLDVNGSVTFADNFTVDTDTFHVDTVNNSVGIGTVSPSANLHVVGNVHVQNATEAFSTTTGAMTLTGGIGVSGNVHAAQYYGDGSKLTGLVTNLEDVANNGNTMSNTIIFENETTSLVTEGSVGIANTAPIHDLDVGSNLYVDDAGSNVLYVTGNVYATRFIGDGAFLENIVTTGKIGIANAAPDHELSVTGNVYVSSEVRVAGGLITNLDGLTKKTYGYSSGTITASTTPEINVVFDSELFSAKITAHLVEPTSNISVLNLDVTGGTGRNIGKGMLSIVGDQNSKHWDTVIATTDTTVTLTPSVGLLSDGTYGIFVEYTSPIGGGGVTSIDKDNTNEITFDY